MADDIQEVLFPVSYWAGGSGDLGSESWIVGYDYDFTTGQYLSLVYDTAGSGAVFGGPLPAPYQAIAVDAGGTLSGSLNIASITVSSGASYELLGYLSAIGNVSVTLGQMTVDGGASLLAGSLSIGVNTASAVTMSASAILTISNGGYVDASDTDIGADGSGTITVAGGGTLSSDSLSVFGGSLTVDGTVSSDSVSLSGGSFTVGGTGSSGSLSLSGGSFTIARLGTVGISPSSTSSYNRSQTLFQSSGVLTVDGDLDAVGAPATFDGVVDIDGTFEADSLGLYAGGSLTIDQTGNVEISQYGTVPAVVDEGVGTLTIDGNLDAADGTVNLLGRAEVDGTLEANIVTLGGIDGIGSSLTIGAAGTALVGQSGSSSAYLSQQGFQGGDGDALIDLGNLDVAGGSVALNGQDEIGGTLAADSLSLNGGSLTIDQSGNVEVSLTNTASFPAFIQTGGTTPLSTLTIDGDLDAASSTVQLNGNDEIDGTVEATDLILAGGSVTDEGVLNSDFVLLQPFDTVAVTLLGGTIYSTYLTLDSGATLSGAGVVDGPIENDGQVIATGGTLVINGDVTGDGQFQIDQGSTLELGGSVAAGETISFADASPGTLILDDPADFQGTIANFAQGDVIDLPNTSPAAAAAPLSVTYCSGVLTLGSIGNFDISGADPVPTFALLPDGNGGTDVETTSLPTLLDLAFDAYNNPLTDPDLYTDFDSTTDAGFKAVAYVGPNAGGGEPSIVISFRGTYQANKWIAFKNIVADLSFLGGQANAMLKRYVSDATSFVQGIVTEFPDAVITLTGHSLGGALAQIVGAGADLAAAGFDAPGSGALFGQLSGLLQSVSGIGYGGTDINYRLNGDQVSEAGTTLGQAFTITSPFPSNTVLQTVANFLNNHALGPSPVPGMTGYQYAYQYGGTASAYTLGVTGTNITGALATTAHLTPIAILLHVIAGIASIIDPPSGTLFTLTGNAGSSDVTSITLPFVPGVGSYDVAYAVGSAYSAFQQIAPGVVDTFPAGVDGVEIAPLDSLGNSTTIEPGFLFTLTFGSSGTFSGTLTAAGSGPPEGEPITTPTKLDVAASAGPTPLGIVSPTDVAYPDPTTLAVGVDTLPTDGTVTLGDGVTAVTVGEVLTVAQLTGLDFAPNVGASGTSSTFTYDVTDPDFATASGSASVDVVCFCRGTRILTERGEVAVEALVVGDRVITLTGEARPITWIGFGRVLVSPGRRSAATPILVRKGALSDNVPHRDLRITKGHSLFLEDVLIPAEFLVNHRSILWDDRAGHVEFYHIELATHDVLLAHGAPAESYRDDGNRWLFQNANTGWDQPPKPPCAPVLTGGPIVDAAWRRLLDRAGTRPGIPTTADPDLHLLIDAEQIDAASRHGSAHIFVLPNQPAGVRIVSRAGAPAELGLARDPRVLGVAIQRIAVRQGTRFRVMKAADPALTEGFHAFEQDNSQRWTDGDAALPAALFEGFEGPMELVLHVGGATRYPLFGEAVRRAAV